MKGSVFTLRGRNQHLKTLHNVRVTLLCGLLTFIVLRSSLGAGKFGTPVQDYDEIRHHLHNLKLRRQHKLLLRRELTDSAPRKDTSRSTLSLPAQQGHVDNANLQANVDHAIHRHVNNAIYRHVFGNKGFLRQPEQRPSPSRPRILLVTERSCTCKSAIEAEFVLKSLKNKIEYCRLHGIEIFYDVEATDTLARVHILRELMLSHPKVEWIWWMDSLAMFTDMLSPPNLERYAGYNVVHGVGGILSSKDNGLDAWDKLWIGGSFLLRNCEWSWNYVKNGGQMQVAEFFIDRRMEMYEPGVGDREAWPLVMHFGSCSLCGKSNIDANCLTHMERAFFVTDIQKTHIASL